MTSRSSYAWKYLAGFRLKGIDSTRNLLTLLEDEEFTIDEHEGEELLATRGRVTLEISEPGAGNLRSASIHTDCTDLNDADEKQAKDDGGAAYSDLG